MTLHTFRATIDQIQICDRAPFGAEFVSEDGQPLSLADTEVRERLSAVRAQLESVAISDHPDDIVFATSLATNIREHDLQAWPHRTRELAATMPLDWILGASDVDVLKLMADNVARQKQHQTLLNQELPSLKANTLMGIQKVINTGLLPDRARALAITALERTAYIALDSFEAAEFNCLGYYDADFTMGLANHFDSRLERGSASPALTGLDKTFSHEAFHGIEFQANHGQHQPHLSWAKEALAEHYMQVAFHSQAKYISPSKRRIGSGSYAANREVLGPIIDDLPFELLGEAYVEPTKHVRVSAWDEIDYRLRKQFPRFAPNEGGSILHAIAKDYNASPKAQRNRILRRWLVRLVGKESAEDIFADENA